ncbi:uncharacterized protein LOC127126273 isoform X3 [Lathyrus oleraceus]|nr:uncharacterized protein LOC127126273 isoform X3 [Pisum sativum]
MENKCYKNVDNPFIEFAYKGNSEVENPKRVFLSPYFPYKESKRNNFYDSCSSRKVSKCFPKVEESKADDSCSYRKVSKHFRKVGESKVGGDSCRSRKVLKHSREVGESKADYSCASRKVLKHFRDDEESKVDDACRSSKVLKCFREVGESKAGESCPSRKVSKYFMNVGDSKVDDACRSRKVAKHLREVEESKAGGSCRSRKVLKHFREVGESKVGGDSCRSRKVSKYFVKVEDSKADNYCRPRKVSKRFHEVGESKVGDSCRSRKVLKHFREVEESKVGDSCPSRKVSKYFLKVEDSAVDNSCPSRNVLEEVEESKVNYQKRVSPCPSRKVKNNCTKKSVTGFRECFKKRKCEGTGLNGNLKGEDSSCLAKIYEYLAKVEEIIIKGSLLLQKVSDSSREGYKIEENCMKDIRDFLNQYVYHGRSVSILRKRVKKSESENSEERDSEYRAIVKEAKVKFESLLGDLSKSFQEGPKVEEGSSLLPPKTKSKSRGKKTQPFLKAERYKEAYKRKTAENNWLPPRSHWNLIQEDHFHDPWRVLVICMLLNRTAGAQ